jgi:hypothetical protein
MVGKPYRIYVQILTKSDITDLGIIDPQAGYCEIKGLVRRQRAKD